VRLRVISWIESLPTASYPLSHTKTHEKQISFIDRTEDNAGHQRRRAISFRPDGTRLLEKDAIAPSAARLCYASPASFVTPSLHFDHSVPVVSDRSVPHGNQYRFSGFRFPPPFCLFRPVPVRVVLMLVRLLTNENSASVILLNLGDPPLPI
jgi:hypothetical protein